MLRVCTLFPGGSWGIYRHENFILWCSLPAMSLADRFCFKQKGGIGGVGGTRVHLKGAHSMVVSRLSFKNALVGSGWFFIKGSYWSELEQVPQSHTLFAAVLCIFLCHTFTEKWFTTTQRINDMNHEQSTSLMATVRMEATYWPQ